MCHLSSCGNCIIHTGYITEIDRQWGQPSTATICFRRQRFYENQTALTTTYRESEYHCSECDRIFIPAPSEYC